MGKPAQKQETISLARFKRAIFFAPIIFWSCINLSGWNHDFRVSSSKNSVDQVSSLRSFMQKGHATSHLARDHVRQPHNPKHDKPSYKTAQDLLVNYQIDTNFCLSLQNISARNMHAHLQSKTYDDLLVTKQSLTQFFEKFETNKRFRKQVSKIKQVGIYKTIKIGKKKIWKSREQIPALKHYANHAYQAVCTTLENIARSTKILCRDFLQTNIGKTAQYFLGRFMLGIKQAGVDIQATLSRENRDGPFNFARDLLQKAKTQPIRETLGDVTQLLSRATINATAVFVAVSAIAVTIETGVAAATGALGAIAAQKFFEPLALSINLDGSVAVESAASSGVSFWQAIATSIAPAIQAFTGVVEQAGNLFCALDHSPSPGSTAGRGGNGGEGTGKSPNKSYRESEIIEFTEKQLQKKFKHAKFFGIDSSWNKTSAQKYKQAILEFINDKSTEVMRAFYRKNPATYYINKTTRLFVVKVDGIYKTGWKLSENQLESFSRSGNLN